MAHCDSEAPAPDGGASPHTDARSPDARFTGGFERDPDGILCAPGGPPRHAEEDYSPALSEVIFETQRDHFWHFGRNDALLRVCRRHLRGSGTPSLLDLGGGWGSFALSAHRSGRFGRIALVDTNATAVRLARRYLPGSVEVFHADGDQPAWDAAWDVVAVLDTIEHLDDDEGFLRMAARKLRPGGLLLVNVPAWRWLWSENDEWIGHKRRYRPADLRALAGRVGLEVRETGCLFRALLPAYATVFARRRHRGAAPPTDEEKLRILRSSHRPPPAWLNRAIMGVLWLENRVTPVVDLFPWGTSAYGALARPEGG